MKKLIQLLVCGLLVVAGASCSRGVAAIDKAYEQACEARSAETVAETLCNGDIQVATLTSEQIAKLGAVLEYLTYTGMYSANFEAQVDMHQLGALLRRYRAHNLTPDEKIQIDSLTRAILLNLPNVAAPGAVPPPPAPGELPPPAPEQVPAE